MLFWYLRRIHGKQVVRFFEGASVRIKEEFKRTGYFWLPSSPEKKVPGTLSIADGGNIELETLGLFEKRNNNLKRIVGYIEKEGYVTLDDCFYTKRVVGNSISKSLVCVNKVFSGIAYDEAENVLLDNLIFSVEGIDEWVGISGISCDYSSDYSLLTIKYSQPKEISFDFDNETKLLIKFQNQFYSSAIAESKITQKIYFQLVSSEKKDIDDFISIAEKITALLCFAIDQIVCLDALETIVPEDIGNSNIRWKEIKIYCPTLSYLSKKPNLNIPIYLFSYNNVQHNFEKIINNWIKAYEIIEPAIDLYFSTKLEHQKYFDGKFLALAQGLETFHRRTSNEKLMKEEEFKKLFDLLVDNCPENQKKWLKDRLNHGNEIPLRKRIKKIIEPFKNFIGSNKERNKIIDDIVNTRNYLTHYDESLKDKAVTGKDLYFLCLKMEAFFQLNLLKILDFTQEEIKSILDNNDQLRKKLKKIE